MDSLADELIEKREEIVQRWYDAWQRSEHWRKEVSEAALKDLLSEHLKLIGEQLRNLAKAEQPGQMWKITQRLDPEKRVGQEIPIEEVVQEYGLAVDVVRDWIAERRIDVPFAEYSYFHQAIFELTAESVRRYAQHQAEVVSQERANYLAGVMHQLRTPLSSLSMQFDVLERTGRAPDAAALGRVRRSLRRLRFLVEGVLRLERFRPSDLPVRPERVRPGSIVNDILSDHAHEAARKGLRLEAHLNRSLTMELDPDLFVDTIDNFVQNAVKYTTAGFVIIDAEEREDDVRFRVRDSGPGIPSEKQPTVFRQTQAASAGGAGLGLLIARQAAEAQGGQIGFTSEPGKGSEFWVRLPRAAPARAGSRPAEHKPPVNDAPSNAHDAGHPT